MKTLRVYDNPKYPDRYTALIPNYRLDTGEVFLDILSITENGGTAFCGTWPGGSAKNLGKRVQYSDLPENIKEALKSRLL